jgi:cytochrome c biogenesis protein CcmG, thiol:disulfide interchange protein DsbE
MGVALGSIGRSRPTAGRLQTIIVMAVTVVAISGISWYVGQSADDGITAINVRAATGITPPTVGKPPTPFTGLTYGGATVSLADYAGKPLWLNFGASWCPDCRAEAADFEATYEKHRGQGLNVLAVFINEPAADVKAYAQRAGLTFPIVVDPAAKIASAYSLVGIPMHILIGRDGLIKMIKIGALSPDDMEKAVQTILP